MPIFISSMKSVFGKALWDYQNGGSTENIITYSSLDEKDVIPLSYLFRDFDDMPALEQKALALCKGTILDIGCGSGSHSICLQQMGKKVIALDNAQGAIETSKSRGVLNTVLEDIYNFKGQKFDTLLLLMNGIGLAGKLNTIDQFFAHLKSLLKPNGQILLDSSDIIYMFDEDDDGGRWVPDSDNYYGEVEFVIEYKKQKSNSFPWLYIDYNTLQRAAQTNNLTCELVMQGEHYDYLARLTQIQ